MADTADVVVVGAGCIGGAITYFLSREGLKVKLVDQEAIGSGASAHATGSLSNVYGPATSSEYLALIGHSSTMALETLPTLQETSGVDVLHVSRPGLRVALNEADARGLQQRVCGAGRAGARGDGVAFWRGGAQAGAPAFCPGTWRCPGPRGVPPGSFDYWAKVAMRAY